MVYWLSFALCCVLGLLAWWASWYTDFSLVEDAVTYETMGRRIALEWMANGTSPTLQSMMVSGRNAWGMIFVLASFSFVLRGARALPLITGPNNFIRIYTPIDPNEVGASQRHNGIWDLNAYRLEIPGITALEVQDNYVRIDGLQVWMTTDTNGALGITFRSSLRASDYEVSNSIVRGNGSGIEDIRVGLEIFSAGSGVLKANNNLFYDWIGSGLTFVAGISPDDPDFTVYLYNNTVVDCEDGINAIQGTVVAKNNLVYNNTDNYVGVFDAASTNNLSGPGPDTEIPLTNAQDGVSVTFVNPGTDDWHLDPSDTGAQDFGTNLAGDPDLAFVDDIDGELRPAPWDIGADEVVAGTGQVHYRWRNDDGGEIGATWAEPEDTKLIGLAKNDPRRLRFQVANNSGVGTDPVAYQLQVAETVNCDVGVYTPVPTVVTDHWRIIDSGFLTDGTATSNVAPGLTDEALTFIDGEVKDLSNTTGTIALADNEFTEIEFSLEATANATDGSDYCFRLFDTVAPGPLPSYVVYAEVRILASAASLTLAEHGAGQVPDQFLELYSSDVRALRVQP